MKIKLTRLLLVTLAAALGACSTSSQPMRKLPQGSKFLRPGEKPAVSAAESCFIEGRADGKAPYSCSFVEFDERGDFMNFAQHKDCAERLDTLAKGGKKLVVIMYCHGWQNNSQSGDVVEFNDFLSLIAANASKAGQDVRVHGIYLGWRGNIVMPFVTKDDRYRSVTANFGEAIVDSRNHRLTSLGGIVPESLSYWNRLNAAENHVSGLPFARAAFTYAAAAKRYGAKPGNKVFAIGHSMGALMIEQSLGQAMVGATIQQWYEHPAAQSRALPFDMILLVNSAAPAIHAKQMRDFLRADRSARIHSSDKAPLLVSLTSTADGATTYLHGVAQILSPLNPTLQRSYTTGVFGDRPKGTATYPEHRPIPQSQFYTKTPGHHPYLLNHQIVRVDAANIDPNLTAAEALRRNLDFSAKNPEVFVTSKTSQPAAAWRIRNYPEESLPTVDGKKPSMRDSNYWIIECGKEIIGSHNDVWNPAAMETYAAIFRLAESRRHSIK